MNTTELNALVTKLIEDPWTTRTANVVAHQIASMRGQPIDEAITHRLITIARKGAVGKYDQHRASLLRAVAEALGCSATVHSEPYFYQGRRRTYWVTLFGQPSDIDTAEKLYLALVGEATERVSAIEGASVAARRRSFFNQFVSTVSMRLREATETPGLDRFSSARERAELERMRAGCESLNLEYA